MEGALIGAFDFIGTRGARVKSVVAFSQMSVGDMRVNLGRRNVGVTEHLLDAAHVGAILDEVSRKTMS